METKIPTPATVNDIDFHVRTYRTALKSNLEVTINSLVNSHLKMESILHPLGSNSEKVDLSALIYSLLRLPHQTDQALKIIVGQNLDIFTQAGYTNVDQWPETKAFSRRRSCFYQSSKHILACFTASISDIDDLVNLLIAFQTEWNKFHLILKSKYKNLLGFQNSLKTNKLSQELDISENDWNRLVTAFGPQYKLRLKRVFQQSLNLRIQLLAASWVNYTKTTQKWWKHIATHVSDHFHISHQQIYFVSSNTHSLMNLFTGFALKNQNKILSLIKTDHPDLYAVWQQIQSKENLLQPNDFLYFVFKFYSDNLLKTEFLEYQQKLGIISIPNSHFLDVDVQIFPVKNLIHSADSRLKISKPKTLVKSEALIFNVDYPLGFSAYHVLTEILENVQKVKGVYILSKAAVLNSQIGDIQAPRLVFDEHTQNSYIFKNCFNSFFPFVNNQGSILTNQKAVSVLGTFLENEALLKNYFENNITIIEMESGPYLNAITEASYDQQTPKNTIIDLNNTPFDLGIINYTSDTPYSQAQNLGSGSLSLNGIEPVNLGSLAILQRIINLEEE